MKFQKPNVNEEVFFTVGGDSKCGEVVEVPVYGFVFIPGEKKRFTSTELREIAAHLDFANAER